MQDLNINGINNNEEEGDYKNRNKSLIVNKNKLLSPTSKSQKNMINFKKQKPKSKYGNISINYYPKTNRALNSNKSLLNNNNSSMTTKNKENKQIKKNLFKNNNKSLNK